MLEAENFLNKIFGNLERVGVDVKGCVLDHVCYRVESIEEYERFKRELAGKAELVHEALISGRPIATYKLHSPLRYQRAGEVREISYLEVPSPKPGSPYRSGLEHAEFVTSETFEAIMARYSHLKFDMSGTAKAVNPELRLSFEDCSVKFHHQSLQDVITFEKNAAL